MWDIYTYIYTRTLYFGAKANASNLWTRRQPATEAGCSQHCSRPLQQMAGISFPWFATFWRRIKDLSVSAGRRIRPCPYSEAERSSACSVAFVSCAAPPILYPIALPTHMYIDKYINLHIAVYIDKYINRHIEEYQSIFLSLYKCIVVQCHFWEFIAWLLSAALSPTQTPCTFRQFCELFPYFISCLFLLTVFLMAVVSITGQMPPGLSAVVADVLDWSPPASHMATGSGAAGDRSDRCLNIGFEIGSRSLNMTRGKW